MTPQTEVELVDTAVQAVQTIASKPASGFVSSEFTVVMATIAPTVLGLIPAQYVPLVTALAGVYAALRTVLKVAHTMGYAKQVPDLPALPPGTVVTSTTQVPKQ